MIRTRRAAAFLLCLAISMTTLVALGVADDKSGKLRFGVGPLQPTPSETKKAYEPFFAYLAKQLNRDFDLVATTDWAGISVALANKQVDLAWMGPWGYVLANDDSGARAIATAKYDGKPIYHAIVVWKPGLVKGWPEGGTTCRRGASCSAASPAPIASSPSAAWTRSDSRTRRPSAPISSRAASSSVWPSPARWRRTPA
jgi:hypothetical protein